MGTEQGLFGGKWESNPGRLCGKWIFYHLAMPLLVKTVERSSSAWKCRESSFRAS